MNLVNAIETVKVTRSGEGFTLSCLLDTLEAQTCTETEIAIVAVR